MKWWHRRQHARWLLKYMIARGRLREIFEANYEDTPEYAVVFAEAQKARANAEYHWAKAAPLCPENEQPCDSYCPKGWCRTLNGEPQ